MGDAVNGMNVPRISVKKAEALRRFAGCKISRMDGFRALSNMTPVITDVQIIRVPRTKRRKLVVFGRYEFEM